MLHSKANPYQKSLKKKKKGGGFATRRDTVQKGDCKEGRKGQLSEKGPHPAPRPCNPTYLLSLLRLSRGCWYCPFIRLSLL